MNAQTVVRVTKSDTIIAECLSNFSDPVLGQYYPSLLMACISRPSYALACGCLSLNTASSSVDYVSWHAH